MNKARVVVTGLGPVTSIGFGKQAFWDSVIAGRSGISQVSAFDTSAYSVSLGGQIKDFAPATLMPGEIPAGMGRTSQLALAATLLAIKDSGQEAGAFGNRRSGIAMGTTSGEPLEIERLDDCWIGGERENIDPHFVDRYPSHTIPLNIARQLGISGPNAMLPTACAAGNYAIGWAFDLIRKGRVERMLAGGADSFSRITYSGFAQLQAIATDQCRPFDKNRQGMVPGEGAAILVLESLESALGRNARIYCEVIGYGLSCDAYHITGAHPEGDGARRAMAKAIRRCGLGLEDIGYISAHGTGTPGNDHKETLAVKGLFGDRAYAIPISSVKSMLGHTMGAASAIEAAVCSLALVHQKAPPTINYETPDPDCDLDYIPNQSRDLALDFAMNNAYAFGGNNSAVIFGAWKGERS